MKNILIKLKQHPKYDTIISWGKLISITGGAQIIVQAVGFVSGILIIRLLPVQEYAFYTLANTMLGTMTVLADGGITAGVMAQGGKVWEDKVKMGVVLATGLDLRKKFAIVSLLVSLPILFYLLLHNNASWLTSILIALALIPAFYAALSDSLLEIVPKLHQTILPLQKNQVGVSLGRLLLTALTMFVFPWAFLGVLAGGIPRLWGNVKLRKLSYEFADEHQLPGRQIRLEILTLVKKIMPTSIYYCVSGQITIWLISIFGNTNSLAQLGALGRIGVLLSVLGTIVGTLIVPRFAKLPMDKKIVLKRFFQIIGLLIISFSFIVFIVYLFPTPILFLLGDAYKGLPFELLLSIISSCISLLGGIVFLLYSAKGWAMSPILMIAINLISIIGLASILDLSNLVGALYFNIWLSCIAFVQLSLFCLYKIIKI
ncbi:polysaccharide biosynthesis protein [Flavobacterium franklandianum]|uniref:polysaccharide biosynthesis protein n=1 Tax=Flavobacterium franklandianum TaxID=2594430 RepID=UPI00117AD74C|nr:polysaccharide biosynthesis protein [Flavobacterium franklandianum]TRX27562.1 polysaccharide biosynthesis protein [Flavobacterium franklandianum]